eukprot:scaffold126644_cov20-Tisochrysis_lutea.AAC.1
MVCISQMKVLLSCNNGDDDDDDSGSSWTGLKTPMMKLLNQSSAPTYPIPPVHTCCVGPPSAIIALKLSMHVKQKSWQLCNARGAGEAV